MLRSLHVKNFAIIEEAALELGPGFNVLAGETGAGKSILIEALGFLLGGRGSASWLRSGASKLEVSGVFDREDFPREIRARFKLGEARVKVSRELDSEGKTRALLNAQSIPLSLLSELGERLVDFHGQHEHQTLLKTALQLDLLDGYGGLEDFRREAAEIHGRWAGLKREAEQSQMSDEERRRRLEFARFQLQEIQEARLSPGEEEELEKALPLLKNGERLKTFAGAAYEVLYEQEGAVLGQLLKAERSLAELAKIDPAMKRLQDLLEGSRVQIEEAAHALGDYREKADVSPGRLDEVLSRQDLISRLKKKYGASVAEILSTQERLAAEAARLEGGEARQEELAAELGKAEAELSQICERLHKARLKAAKKLEKALAEELQALGMPQARFCVGVVMEEGRFSSHGSDSVEFMLAPNPGEASKPLRSSASGGELSRVMLAVKTALAQADRVPILVFDEVDAGIGGTVARAVGQKLAGLGRGRQILCVTHLPQVACFAARHFGVSKGSAEGRTCVQVRPLEGSARLEAVATMLGGRQATAASRRHAQELLDSSRLEETTGV